MKQEDAKLLIEDICARMPYGIKCFIPEINSVRKIAAIHYDCENTLFDFLDESTSQCRNAFEGSAGIAESGRNEFSDVRSSDGFGERCTFAVLYYTGTLFCVRLPVSHCFLP